METNQITAAEVLIAVMKEVQSVGKNEVNKSQNFKFRGIDAVMNAVGPALRKVGGFIIPTVIEKTSEVIPSKAGGSLNVVRLTVQFAVYGQTGEPITGTVAAESFDSGDKATAKAMSVAYRTFLLQSLALPTDEPDPDHDTYEIGNAAAMSLETRATVLRRINTAKTRSEMREIWNEYASHLDESWASETGEVVSLKSIITQRVTELPEEVETDGSVA